MKKYTTLLFIFVSVLGYSQQEISKTRIDSLPAYDENQLYNTAGIEKKPEYPGVLYFFAIYL